MVKDLAPVILVKNLSGALVNGLMGTVIELEFGEIIVEFPSVGEVKIEKERFEGKYL